VSALEHDLFKNYYRQVQRAVSLVDAVLISLFLIAAVSLAVGLLGVTAVSLASFSGLLLLHVSTFGHMVDLSWRETEHRIRLLYDVDCQVKP